MLRVNLKIILLIVGLSTLLLSSAITLGRNNIKKVIAFSTMRHIGLIVIIVGFGATSLAFFHLLSHSFFKCSLFMYSGYYLHRSLGNADIRIAS